MVFIRCATPAATRTCHGSAVDIATAYVLDDTGAEDFESL
jgi:hypothetical protein